MDRDLGGTARKSDGGGALMRWGVVLLLASLALAEPVRAQCVRTGCAASDRDERGCCPARSTHASTTPRRARVRAAEPAACLPGQIHDADTEGHCCWPAQAWSSSQRACVGAPSCPSDRRATGSSCECPEGMTDRGDARGHCCWPGQVFAAGQSACVGDPACPRGTIFAFDMCAPAITDPRSCGAHAECPQHAERCARGDGGRCDRLAYLYEPTTRGHVAEDWPRAMALLERSCELGAASGCAHLATHLRSGEGIARDEARAHRLAARGCELGDPFSCLTVSVDLRFGRGIGRDADAAQRATRVAADAYARLCTDEGWNYCAFAGQLLASSEVGSPDRGRAQDLLQRAIRGGQRSCPTDARWCTTAARAALVAGDRSSAIALLRQGCARADTACGWLVAWGTPEDATFGRAQLDQRCDGGSQAACYTAAETRAGAGRDPAGLRRSYLRYCAPHPTSGGCPLPERDPGSAAHVSRACDAAPTLLLGSHVRGTLRGAGRIASLCGQGATGPEQVYRLTIASRGSVRVAVASLFDAVVSIRRTCGELASELACNDDDPATDHAFGDRRAALTLDLQPGTYFVVVDGFNPDQQGDFEVSAELVRP